MSNPLEFEFSIDEKLSENLRNVESKDGEWLTMLLSLHF
jgi:hypothetical protein